MPSPLNVMTLALTFALFVDIAGAFGAPTGSRSDTQLVLEKAAEEMQVEMSLGQVAAQRASNEQVQKFGQHMAEDHKKVGEQIELLAFQQGLKLASTNRDEQRNKLDKKLEKLSLLSGHAFDREYMDYSIRDHEITIEEFRRRVGIVRNQDIKQWILLVLPLLESHLKRAHQVKYSLQTNP